MAEQHLPTTDSFQLYLNEMGKVPLLKPEEERRLALELESSGRELRALVLSSPIAMRQIKHWAELITLGEMDAKELLPRGRPSPAKRAALRKELLELASKIKRADLRRHAPRAELLRRLVALPLHPEKVLRIARRIQDEARRAREGRPLRATTLPLKELFALETKVLALESRVENAKVSILRANLRLVVSVARGYAARHNVELSDLIQEGTLGLMRAIEKYKPARGFRFSTYATWWIRQAVSRAVSSSERTVRVPAHVQERIAKVRRAAQTHLQQSGRPARIEDYARLTHLTTAKVEDAIEAMQETVSLGVPVGEEQEQSLEDMLPDPGQEPSAPAELAVRNSEVERWLAGLSEREAGVIKMRFGIGRTRSSSLDEVGREFHITRERARQIQVQAIRKLRHSPLSDSMRDYA